MKQIAKFDIRDLLPIGLTVAVTAIAISYALQVQGDVQDDMTTDSHEFNATGDGITAVATVTDKLGLVVTVIMAAVIIGILIRYLSVR